MKRVYERLLFIGIGAFIAILAYALGIINSSNAQDTIQATKDSAKIGNYDIITVKKGIIIGDINTKGNLVAGIIVNPITDIAAISLGISDGKGSIAIDDNAIIMTIGSNKPPSLQVIGKHGTRAGITIKDDLSHIILYDKTGKSKMITTE